MNEELTLIDYVGLVIIVLFVAAIIVAPLCLMAGHTY